MDHNGKIIVVTPTYNRVNTLPRLYASLKKQKDMDFEWLIIDDGSYDYTNEYINNIKSEGYINIKYVYQDNGGKCRALNRAFELVDCDSLVVIVDSDDYLLDNAIETFRMYSHKYSSRSDICALFFYYKLPSGEILNPKGEILTTDVIMNRYEYNKKFKKNDGCICYFAKALKNYKYLEISGENYIAPTTIQMEMAQEYLMVFSKEVVGVAEYQEDGLTKSGRAVRLANPIGMIYYSVLQQSPQNSWFMRIKSEIGAQSYRIQTNLSKKELQSFCLYDDLKKWAYLPGFLMLGLWKLKCKYEN